MNKLVLVADKRTFEIQQMDYRDRAAVLNVIETNNDILVYEVDQVVKKFYELSKFKERMDLVCNTGFDSINQQYFLRQIPIAFGNYYNTIGPEKLRVLLSRNLNIKAEYERMKSNQVVDVRSEIIAAFPIGTRVSSSNAKETLREIYERVGYDKSPKATDLLDYFNCSVCGVLRDDDTKKRDRGFEILSIKQ